jgi:hypothetical protein
MATVQQIRTGIKTRLDTIDGLRAQASWTDSVNSPAAIVVRRSTEFDTSFDAESDDYGFAVTVLIKLSNQRAQETLDAYLAGSGASSIRAAINGDPTLGGVVDFARAASVGRDRIVEWAGIKYLAADVVIEVG